MGATRKALESLESVHIVSTEVPLRKKGLEAACPVAIASPEPLECALECAYGRARPAMAATEELCASTMAWETMASQCGFGMVAIDTPFETGSVAPVRPLGAHAGSPVTTVDHRQLNMCGPSPTVRKGVNDVAAETGSTRLGTVHAASASTGEEGSGDIGRWGKTCPRLRISVWKARDCGSLDTSG